MLSWNSLIGIDIFVSSSIRTQKNNLENEFRVHMEHKSTVVQAHF